MKTMCEMLDYYYETWFGIQPDKINYNTTLATAEHLADNGFTLKEILNIFLEIQSEKITPEDLPERLWEESLTDKGKHYYHRVLRIKSKPSTINIETGQMTHYPYFLEMKILYTIRELVARYYTVIGVPVELQDYKRDTAQFQFLFKKYSKVEVEPLDFILKLIDTAAQQDDSFISEPFKLDSYAKEVNDYFKAMVPNATKEKANLIYWRSYNG